MGSLLSQQQPYKPQQGFSYDPKQVQQLEGGGLQTPTIDPVMVAATGMVPYFGPMGAARQLVQQVVANQLTGGLPDAVHKASQYLPKLSGADVNDLLQSATFDKEDPITKVKYPVDYLTHNLPTGDDLKKYYFATRYGTTVPDVHKYYNPDYGDMWDKFIYKTGDVMDKIFKSPVATAVESAAE